MADEKDVEQEKKDSEQEKTDSKTSGSHLMKWIPIAVVVAFCAGAGFGLGRLLGGLRAPETSEASQQNGLVPAEELIADSSAADSQKIWYYNLEPVVANLNEPGVRRYVRATLTLAISSQMDQKKGTAFLEEKKPILTNWLTIYLASLNLEDIRGDRNLRRIQSQILDTFNEKLFPDSRPLIEKILFKEFAVQ